MESLHRSITSASPATAHSGPLLFMGAKLALTSEPEIMSSPQRLHCFGIFLARTTVLPAFPRSEPSGGSLP